MAFLNLAVLIQHIAYTAHPNQTISARLTNQPEIKDHKLPGYPSSASYTNIILNILCICFSDKSSHKQTRSPHTHTLSLTNTHI
ncbi:hypothetical protein QBC35DRAFT_499317 [Podospora australis]|uniref:Uncharacterized protein n=1 Tax=Podospora australis TaxID=1536484 RepID=A0AAN7AHW4_9PEZI|nr:hypothetical protein QBC35DRAFT_499317 [Podospora australis]